MNKKILEYKILPSLITITKNDLINLKAGETVEFSQFSKAQLEIFNLETNKKVAEVLGYEIKKADKN